MNKDPTEFESQNEENFSDDQLAQSRILGAIEPGMGLDIVDAGYETRPANNLEKARDSRSLVAGSYEYIKESGIGSFGVVYQAKNINTEEVVAIKRVLQNKRYKNRELQIMKMMDHPNVVKLIDSYVEIHKDKVYLSLVLEYMPLNLHQYHVGYLSEISMFQIKLYMYQLLRSLSYIHGRGICHRDIKPQNLLVNNATHELKLCDFGSAKILTHDKPNVTYICSRYYRAPELIFEAKEYTTAIDIWSAGCILAELLLGKPLFAGETQTMQLIEIIKVLGTPTKEELVSMNSCHELTDISKILPHPWKHIFPASTPPEAIELITKMLIYDPKSRIDPLEACAHPFFDELRTSFPKSPNSKQLPQLFNFIPEEIKRARELNILDLLMPS